MAHLGNSRLTLSESLLETVVFECLGDRLPSGQCALASHLSVGGTLLSGWDERLSCISLSDGLWRELVQAVYSWRRFCEPAFPSGCWFYNSRLMHKAAVTAF